MIIRGEHWNFKYWSLDRKDLFSNTSSLFIEYAKYKMNGIDKDDKEKQYLYFKDRYLTYIFNTFERGDFINNHDTFNPLGRCYIGEDSGQKFLVEPYYTDRMIDYVLQTGRLKPGDEEEFHNRAHNEWYDRNRNCVIFDKYSSNTNHNREGSSVFSLASKNKDLVLRLE